MTHVLLDRAAATPHDTNNSDDVAASRHDINSTSHAVDRMLTIAVFSQKGGAGKSTLAVHLAVAASVSMKVVLIDADPQATVATWAADRAKHSPFVARAESSTIEQLLASARDEGYDLAIIDCPPHAAPGTAALLRSADHVVIPAQPTMPDLTATARSVALARAAGKQFSFVVNRAPSRAPEVSQAIEALRTGAPVAPVVIGDRRAFSRALTDGLAVTEFASSTSKAATEINGYWQWLYAQIRREQWQRQQAVA
ncbi:AAA family ATPase [Methylibium rhizosphaerae]|uniref:AAA family ATPase n=1 Tax=Methylibium rhizosphaerae TaxID=2570323 RepID=UPI00112D59CB|nr:ParA family protein [Methylibium rhizosphaerae]